MSPQLQRFALLAISIWATGIQGNRALGGEYTLTEGQGLPICEAYRQNFEPRHDAEPMACERHYNPAIHGFSAIPWQRLDLTKHFQLYREAEINLATNTDDGQGMTLSAQEAAEIAKALESKAMSLRVELYVARLPLFGTAHPVNVLGVREVGCGPMPKPDVKISRLFVLNEEMTHIDPEKQKHFQGWGNNATLTLYKDGLYLEAYRPDDNWGTMFTGNGILSVYQHGASDFERVCRVSFKSK